MQMAVEKFIFSDGPKFISFLAHNLDFYLLLWYQIYAMKYFPETIFEFLKLEFSR